MHNVDQQALRQWMLEAPDMGPLTGRIGGSSGVDALEDALGLPLHLEFAYGKVAATVGAETPPRELLASIPFHSLCRGLFLPLSGLHPERAGAMFGVECPEPPTASEKDALLGEFLGKDLGLGLAQKLGCVLGDPFQGKPSRFRRDSLVRLLLSVEMVSRRSVLDRLTQVGDVSVLFAQHAGSIKSDPPLTAAEVLVTLEHLGTTGRRHQFELLRSILQRCGRMEAYFLAKLVMRKAGFGYDYQGPLLARVVGEHFGAEPEAVQHAVALTDFFQVARVLAEDGPEGLKKIRLQPLVAVRPALASGTTDQAKTFPVWVERKYDGIRFMLHKSTDNRGNVLCASYTRGRRDWMELVPGLEAVIRSIPAHSVIVDGELYGTVADLDGARPATVYEVYGKLQGESGRAVQMRFAAFDLLFLNGQDLTPLPLQQRRQQLQALIQPLSNLPLPVPVKVAEGQMAQDGNDIKRLYGHFRSQGYEGVITKHLDAPYRIASRDPTWLKKKPEVTLDLVLLAGVFAVTGKAKAGMFGSYVIGARTRAGEFIDIGDVAGVDTARDQQIQAEIMREGLITGNRIERHSASGVRPGIELRPHIVVTVRFEGLIKDPVSGDLKLRDPKLVHIRSDKGPYESDLLQSLEELYLRQRVG